MIAMRAIVEPNKGHLQGMGTRDNFDSTMECVAAPLGVTCETDDVGGTPGVWCRPENARPGEAVLHIYGNNNGGSSEPANYSLEVSS